MATLNISRWSDIDQGELADSVVTIADTTGNLSTPGTITASGAVTGASLKVPANGNILTLAGSATQAADLTFTFPANVGTANYMLATDGTSGNLSWVAGEGTGTVTSVGVSGSTGLTVSGSPITSAGSISLTLGTELQGLSGLSASGIVSRTGAGAYASRTLTAGSSNLSITNGNGAAGNPTVDLSATLTSLTSIGTATLTATGAVTGGSISTAGGVTATGTVTGGTFVPSYITTIVRDALTPLPGMIVYVSDDSGVTGELCVYTDAWKVIAVV